MGRSITFDNEVQENINTILKSKQTQSGLIIGQCIGQKDIVIRLCPTPPKDDSLEKEAHGDVESTEKSGKKEKGTSKKDKNAIDLDEKWICQHAKQITRTLPGGLDVLGLYIAAPSDAITVHQLVLRQILFAIYKILAKDQKISVNAHVIDRILLQICTVSFKCTARTFDISDYKSSSNPAEWKTFPGKPRWHKIQLRLAVDLKFAVKQENRTQTLLRQIECGLAPFFKNIENAMPLINGMLRQSEEMLDTSLESKKSKQKDKEQSPQQCYNVELFIPLDSNNNVSKPNILDCSSMMIVKGTVQCRAFVHSKATVKEAIEAIKQDIIRSVTARCEIHCEDLLLIDEEQQDPIVVHELPRRVFAPLPQGEICVCDYQFHGDSASDSLDAFKELLNLDLADGDVETSCEISPTTSALIQPEVMEDRLSEFGDHPPANRNILFPVASAAIAAVAAGLSYFLLIQEN